MFIGDDWGEAHHDIEIQSGDGTVLARAGWLRGWPG